MQKGESWTSPLCRVVLVEPLIPENTGNVARTCVGTQSALHLVGPLGYEITEKRVKRAGLDYWEDLQWQEHADVAAWRRVVDRPDRVFYIETSGQRSVFENEFQLGDWLVFGKETSGLSAEILAGNEVRTLSLPMLGPTRSLNLANSVAVVVFELFRQNRDKISGRSP